MDRVSESDEVASSDNSDSSDKRPGPIDKSAQVTYRV